MGGSGTLPCSVRLAAYGTDAISACRFFLHRPPGRPRHKRSSALFFGDGVYPASQLHMLRREGACDLPRLDGKQHGELDMLEASFNLREASATGSAFPPRRANNGTGQSSSKHAIGLMLKATLERMREGARRFPICQLLSNGSFFVLTKSP